MIEITEQPPGIATVSEPTQPPVPLSDCLRWCMQPDATDAITTPGSKATLTITIPATCSVPADGTTFKIWGYDFTVDSAQDFTAGSFKVVATGVLTWINLANMFYANVFFNRAVVITGSVVGSDFELVLTWRECREQPRFTVENMDLAVFTTIGGSGIAVNGISPVYVEAFRLLVRPFAWQDATNSGVGIGNLIGLESEKQCSTVGETCVVLNPDIAGELYTPLPELTVTSFTSTIDLGRTMMRLFSLEYGWTYREDCVAKSGTIMRSKKVLVLNAAFDDTDPYQMRRYWYDHPDGFPPDQFVVDYLTTQPKTIKLCNGSFKWLWMLNNWQDDFGQYNLKARFVIYDQSNAISSIEDFIVNDSLTMGSSWHQPVNFNVSPGFLVDQFGVNLANVSAYEVQVVGVETLDPDAVLFNATEYLRFEVGHCCEEITDLYFLNPCGGIDTILVTIDEIEVVQGGQEVNIEIPCGASRHDKATNGGRTLVNLRSYVRYKMSINLGRSEANTRWIKHLRQSPQRWIKVTDEGGTPMAKKILFDSAGVKSYENGLGITVEITGYLQDIPTQPGTEKRLQL